jgi:hypothetical protein
MLAGNMSPHGRRQPRWSEGRRLAGSGVEEDDFAFVIEQGNAIGDASIMLRLTRFAGELRLPGETSSWTSVQCRTSGWAARQIRARRSPG